MMLAAIIINYTRVSGYEKNYCRLKVKKDTNNDSIIFIPLEYLATTFYRQMRLLMTRHEWQMRFITAQLLAESRQVAPKIFTS